MSAIDLASSPLIGWLDTSLMLARLLVPVALAAAIAGAQPLGPRRRRRTRRGWWSLGARAVVVAGLVTAWGETTCYALVIGWLWDASMVAVDLKTSDGWRQLGELAGAIWANQGEPQWSLPPVDGDDAGPAFVRAAVAALPTLGQACLLGVCTLGRILSTALLLAGPVVLALSLAQTSDLLRQWVRTTAAVLSWPWLTTTMVALAVAIVPGLGSGSSAGPQAAGLGVALIGAAACVPLLSWRLTGALAVTLAPWARVWSTLARVATRRSAGRANEVSIGPRHESALEQGGRRTRRPGHWGTGYPMQRASGLGEAPLRATPPLPLVGLGVEPFEASPRLSPASEGPRGLTASPVVPSQVRHGVIPIDPATLGLPTPPDGHAAPPAYEGPRPPARAAREVRRAGLEVPWEERTRPLALAIDSAGEPRPGGSAPGSTRATEPMVTPAPIDRVQPPGRR